MDNQKVEIVTLQEMKAKGHPITMVTAYDFPTARLVDSAGVDTILVGDSLSNVVLGHPDTLPVTIDEMIHHLKAVARGVRRAFLIVDMPFMSYNVSIESAVTNAGRFMKEGSAQAVKIEGGDWIADTARAMVRAGIPVVGHLGLTPQTAHFLGGYRAQGRTSDAASAIIRNADLLEQAGVTMLVLECVPDRVAAIITKRLRIPVIGIGAGVGCDGQVLVFHDLLGFDGSFKPKHVKRFAELGEAARAGLEQYCQEVRSRTFPDASHSFSISDEEFAALQSRIGEKD
jgi:3-methyl-2-oxobutanoate hydroxymethyltransferase